MYAVELLQMIKGYDDGFKVILAGNSGVGKSSMLFRFAENYFPNKLSSTIGVDFKFKTMEVNGRNVKMQIWDTAGTQNFRSIVSAYYRGADAIVLIYSMNDRASFKDLEEFWIQEVNRNKDGDCEIVLLGNKLDLKNDVITERQIREFMIKEKINLYREVSAKTGNQVTDAFRSLAQKLTSKKRRSSTSISSNRRTIGEDIVQEIPSKKCCS